MQFSFLNALAANSEVFDKYILSVAFLLFLYFIAYTGWEKVRIVLTTAISFIVAREAITPIVRFLYYRPWPLDTNQIRLLFGDSKVIGGDSWTFPSGHAAFLIAIATAIYLYDKKWGIVFFIYAIVMIIIRTIASVYQPLDSVGGIIIGVLTAYEIFYLIEKRKIFRF